MNQADRKEFELIHNKIDTIKEDIVELKQAMDQAHIKSYQDIKFIKEAWQAAILAARVQAFALAWELLCFSCVFARPIVVWIDNFKCCSCTEQ